MEAKAAVKVGIMVLIGFAVFGAVWYFLAHLNPGHYRLYAVFRDTKGLQPQTPLRMNGVAIGEVEKVELDKQTLHPVVTLTIADRYRVPVESSLVISSGILITNPQIEIIPPKNVAGMATYAPGSTWDAAYVQKEPSSALAQLSPEADKAMKQLTVTVQTLTPRLTKTMDELHGILKRTDAMMVNFQAASLSARNLVADPQIRFTMHQLLADMRGVSHDARVTARDMSTELRSVVRRNSTKVDELTTGAVDLLQKFADTVDAARGAITRLTEQVSDPRLQQALLDTMEMARTMLARFNQVASDIHNLSGDPNVQSDLKTTVATLKDTAQDAQQLVQRVNAIVGNFKSGAGRPRLGIGRPEVAIDLFARTNAPHFRSDVNLRLPIGNNNAFNLGIYDFAERYKLNAQYETDINGLGALRYGIYASKLGVGLSWPDEHGTRLRLDAYDPNNPQFDAKLNFKINNDFSLWLGADSLFKHTTPLLGVRLSR